MGFPGLLGLSYSHPQPRSTPGKLEPQQYLPTGTLARFRVLERAALSAVRTLPCTIPVAFSHGTCIGTHPLHGCSGCADDDFNEDYDDDDNANGINDDDVISPALVATVSGSPAAPCRWWTSLAGRRWGLGIVGCGNAVPVY